MLCYLFKWYIFLRIPQRGGGNEFWWKGNKKASCFILSDTFYQCLGSGSVGSTTFWLPGSGSADPDPRGKISTKTKNVDLQTQTKTKNKFNKSFWMVHYVRSSKKSEKRKKIFEIFYVKKKSVNLEEMFRTLIRIRGWIRIFGFIY